MKNILELNSTVVIIVLLFSFIGFSQEINFGAKAGLNVSSLRGDYPDAIDKKPIVGFHIGGFAEYSINENIAIQPEVLFSRQGLNTEQVQESSGERLKQSIRLNYLNLAIMGKYKVLDKLYVEFGPQIGYVLSGNLKLEFEDPQDASRNETVDYDLLKGGTFDFLGVPFERKRSINKLDFGLNIGASYDFNENIVLQLRYNYGLFTLTKDSASSEGFESWDLKNSALQFSIGYQF